MIAFTLLFAAHAMGRTRKADPIAPKRYFSVEASAEASQLEEQASFEALQAEVQQLQADKQQLKEENQKLTEYMALKDQVAALRADKASLLEENQRLHDELDPHAEEHAGKAGENQRLHNGKVPAQESSQPHASGALLNTTQAATHNASAKVHMGIDWADGKSGQSTIYHGGTMVYLQEDYMQPGNPWTGSRSSPAGREYRLLVSYNPGGSLCDGGCKFRLQTVETEYDDDSHEVHPTENFVDRESGFVKFGDGLEFEWDSQLFDQYSAAEYSDTSHGSKFKGVEDTHSLGDAGSIITYPYDGRYFETQSLEVSAGVIRFEMVANLRDTPCFTDAGLPYRANWVSSSTPNGR